ncbi:hypothetical protein Ae168Ps1_6389c [Pseudonocardia sp. Ae168_Ps1]|uniref:hypothetical protein n=1 Tax=unclassified Pseudonocardia TaxID=2619320 RepID=UPI00094B2204|nr:MULTISPECIES: hypothetical protein [unclassified Pseudonocardia]OLL69832.1 hypothetical protein Ae150APs1_6243c [Pseudonocardia sp. Ae150A_Ps1]OLL69964.1 hypothetical protein Ae168Ps1_6389c [Pseudonocardia sp. Ae168_Ps1]OLL89125.1 hypothetical protein Ae356Ps1_6242c [Pseudonocardia sp. Ae356_Ps1]
MPETPIFAYRYPASTDPPNGPAQIQALAEDVEAGGIRFANYTCGQAVEFSTGSWGLIPFEFVMDTSPSVTRSDSNRRFTFNVGGVWRIEAGVRVAKGGTGQTQFFAILAAGSTTTRYAESASYQSGSGGSYSVARARRFESGQAINIGTYRTGSGSFEIATDVSQATYVSMTWIRP